MKPNSSTNALVRFRAALRRVPRSTTVLVMLGEVDVGYLVWHRAQSRGTPVEEEFATGNVGLTEDLCDLLARAGNKAPVVYASSTQALADNPYGRSKLAAERVLFRHGETIGAPVTVFRLTNVFGKWARPDYNSAVATFCHRIANGGEIAVRDARAPLALVYIDDVVAAFARLIEEAPGRSGFGEVQPVYSTTVGEVADLVRSFAESRATLISPPCGSGLVRALYSTYLSYLPLAEFEYRVPIHGDPRGAFVEMLKTPDTGQFSYFTAHPGVTRGDHYHHTKAEKFLVIAGKAHFGFRHIITGETHEIVVQGGEGRIVETIPGWTHNVTNVGGEQLIVMLWANEIFDRARPDTIAMKV